jgi:hypothetical protein
MNDIKYDDFFRNQEQKAQKNYEIYLDQIRNSKKEVLKEKLEMCNQCLDILSNIEMLILNLNPKLSNYDNKNIDITNKIKNLIYELKDKIHKDFDMFSGPGLEKKYNYYEIIGEFIYMEHKCWIKIFDFKEFLSDWRLIGDNEEIRENIINGLNETTEKMKMYIQKYIREEGNKL